MGEDLAVLAGETPTTNGGRCGALGRIPGLAASPGTRNQPARLESSLAARGPAGHTGDAPALVEGLVCLSPHASNPPRVRRPVPRPSSRRRCTSRRCLPPGCLSSRYHCRASLPHNHLARTAQPTVFRRRRRLFSLGLPPRTTD